MLILSAVRGRTIPMVSQFPSPAQDYRGTRIDLNDVLVKDKAATLIFTVSDDSMRDAGICDGDEVLCDSSIRAQSGQVVITSIDGE
ncbi:hypothetical protein JR346_09125 [Rothia sp. ZJ932]|nr:hypothetical protein JR346_09125 [Rothia sp. ZJ932]